MDKNFVLSSQVIDAIKWDRSLLYPGGAYGVRAVDGLDGVRFFTLPDGNLICISGAEQGGDIIACIKPADEHLHEVWPKVLISHVKDTEDASFQDLDQDGVFEAVMCSEGGTKKVSIAFSPDGLNPYAGQARWETLSITSAEGVHWMMADSIDLLGRGKKDIVAGSKGVGSVISIFIQPDNIKDMAAWQRIDIAECKWVMNLTPRDMNGNGLLDLFVTDRGNGVYWLENPGPDKILTQGMWTKHMISPHEKMTALFGTFGDIDGDGKEEVAVALMGPGGLLVCKPLDDQGLAWSYVFVPAPKNRDFSKDVSAHLKAATVVDYKGVAVVVSTVGKGYPVFLVRPTGNPYKDVWTWEPISNYDEDHKLDMVIPMYFEEGRLALVSTEERAKKQRNGGLGIIWYESP